MSTMNAHQRLHSIHLHGKRFILLIILAENTYSKNLPVRNKNKPPPSKTRKKATILPDPLWTCELINFLGVHLMPIYSLAEAQRKGWRWDGLQIE